MTDKTDLAALRALAQAATPGPWYVGAQNDALFIIAGRTPAPVAKVFDPNDGDEPFINPRANAALLAAAPALLDRLTAAEAENARLREVLRFYAREWFCDGDAEQTVHGWVAPYGFGPSEPSDALLEDRGQRARAALEARHDR